MDRKKILLIDDDVSQLDLIEILFKKEGFEVYQAISGDDAINKISENEILPDAILVDLMMPKLSGSETVKKIRELKYSGPIVAFTALDDVDSHQEALEAGCNLILTKPCKPAELVTEVSKFMIKSSIN